MQAQFYLRPDLQRTPSEVQNKGAGSSTSLLEFLPSGLFRLVWEGSHFTGHRRFTNGSAELPQLFQPKAGELVRSLWRMTPLGAKGLRL